MGSISQSCLTCNQCGFNVLMLICMQILKDPMYICVPTEYHNNDMYEYVPRVEYFNTVIVSTTWGILITTT